MKYISDMIVLIVIIFIPYSQIEEKSDMNRKPSKKFLWLYFILFPVIFYLLSYTSIAVSSVNLLSNPGFEEVAADRPAGWQIEQKNAHKGDISINQEHAQTGRNSLELIPSDENTGTHDLLGVGQAIDATPYRGKLLRISGWLAAEGEAKANLAVYLMTEKIQGIDYMFLQQPDSDGEYRFHENSIVIPEANSRWIIVTCTVDGKSGTASFDDLFLGVAEQEDIPPERETLPLEASITIHADKSIRHIPRTLFGTNAEWKWDGNGIWDRKSGELQKEIVEPAKAMRVNLIRYPGGTMSDYYHWREGIGAIEKRPFRSPLPEEDKSQLVFGTNEALEFAKLVGANLLITVNMVTGSAEEAAAWVEYINKEQSVHDKSKRVTYWQLGNENYIQWIPAAPEYFKTSSLSADQYIKRVKSYSKAMKAVDSSIKLIGILDLDPNSEWNREVLAGIADMVDYVSLHNGYAPGFVINGKPQIRKLYKALLAKPIKIRENLRAFSEKIEALGSDSAENLKLAVTEWGPIFSVDINSVYLNHTQTLGSGLYAASVLMALVDSSRTDIANFFHLVDQLFMGWLGMRDGHYIMKPTAMAFQLFTEHIGDILVKSHTDSPTYDSPLSFEQIPPIHGVPYLETLASVDEEGEKLFIMVINKHFDVPIDTEIILEGFKPNEKAWLWTLTGTGIDANLGAELFQAPGIEWQEQIQDPFNPRYAKGGPGEVEIRRNSLDQVKARFRYSFPPHSITAIEIQKLK
jgi:alpha-N-arabinofuranosidase